MAPAILFTQSALGGVLELLRRMDQFRFRGARHAARIDRQVGELIRKRRVMLGYTQEQLAEALDISYQQIQKYETGANRVSAGRLYQIAQRLETPISFFFEGLGVNFEDGDNDVPANRATMDIARSFAQIGDPGIRTALAGLARALAAAEAERGNDLDGSEGEFAPEG